jgi:hypothetical protein
MYESIASALDRGCFKQLLNIDPVTYTYVVYDQWYRLGTPMVSDQEFDAFEQLIQDMDPENPALNRVGGILPTCPCCVKVGA